MADQISLRRETNLYDDETIKAVNDKVTSQYAVSTTASATVAKTATVDGDFTLYKNARVSVFFQNANTSTSPTLNVAGTGAKPIWAYGGPLSADGNTFNWVANSTIEFVYDGEHWLVADSGAVGLISKYDEKLSQEVVFNKLTNNGEIRGIFMKDGQMYINMDYLQTGTLKLGGANNGNGLLVVYDASGNEIGRWDKDGLSGSGNFKMFSRISSYTLESSLAEITYYDYNLVSGTLNSYTGNGFQIQRKTSNTLTGQFSVVILPAGGIIESIHSKDSYSKRIYIGDENGNGHYISIASGAYGFGINSYECGSPSTAYSTYRVTLRGGRADLYGFAQIGTLSNFGIIRLNGSASRNSRSSGDCWFEMYQGSTTQGYLNAYIQDNIYFRYNGSYWNIKGANQDGNIALQSSSSKRYKHAITEKIGGVLNAKKLYNLPMKQFIYNDDFEHLQYMDMKGQTIPGFIAEDVAEIYPAAVIHDENGNIESWDERRIIPGMLALIQEQKKQLDEQAERIKKLESNTSFIHMV